MAFHDCGVGARDHFGASRWLRHALALTLMCAAACAPSARLPSVAPNRVLTPTVASGQSQKDAPFRVVFAGPRGEASEASALSVVFDRPLRALAPETPGRTERGAATPPVRVTPAPDGQWQWVGTHAVLFVPKAGSLPGATHYRVEVPGSTRALDGSTLGRAHQFEFTTPRPKLVRSSPYTGDASLEPDAGFELFFNQRIELAALQRATSLTAVTSGKSTRLEYRLQRPDARAPKRVALKPVKPLPVHSAITLRVAESLQSQEGPLPSGVATELSYRTYGPLVVERYECDRDTPRKRCAAGSSVSLSFSNPVKLRDVQRALSVTPAVKLRFPDGGDDAAVYRYVTVSAGFEAGKSYTFRLSAELRDRYAQRLARPYSQQIAFDDFWPALDVGVRGDYLEPPLARSIPVASINLPRYELLTAALSAEQVRGLHAVPDSSDQFAFLARQPKVSLRRVEPRSARNALAKEILPTEALLGGANKPGVLAVATRHHDARSQRARTSVKVLQITDLALSAKLSRHGSLVWVTRLSTGAPVAGARVEIATPGAAVRVYTADANGIARVPARDFAPDLSSDGPASRALLLAKSGADWAFRRVSDFLEPWRMNVPVDVSGKQSTYGLLFTERGLYRPGDAVQVKGIVRLEHPAGNALPTARSVKLELRSADGDVVAKQATTLTRFGTFAAEFKLPRGAGLGNWVIESRGLPSGEVSGWFEVAEYRAAEFKVTTESDKPSYVRGGSASFSARGDYLFGAPMPGAAARFSVSRSRAQFSPPGAEGYSTNPDAYLADLDQESFAAGQLAAGEVKLDAQGEYTVKQALVLPGQRTPEYVTFDAEVTDVNRQAFAASSTAIVHPAQVYVAIQKLEDYFVRAPGKLKPQVLVMTPDGKKLAGQRVQLELIRRRWVVAKKRAGTDDVESVSQAVDTRVATCNVVTREQPAGCELALAEGGYYLVRGLARDAKGNPAEAALSVYGIGGGGAWWSDRDDRTLELVTNKQQYRAGESARVLVKSPFPEAEALVTVERAGVYRAERVKLNGPTPTLTVPITEDMRPNAYVGVHLIRPRTSAEPNAPVGEPTYRVGYTQIVIDPEARRLKVDLRTNKRDLKPGEELSVDVSVKDSKGAPSAAEVTLYAVDEGVLSLIGYKTPDPVPVFTASRPLQVATLEARSALARVRMPNITNIFGLNKGEEGGGGGESTPRRDFRQSAYFNPRLETNAQGRASARFKLPESLTTYRVMAVAVTAGDAYGYAASNVTTSKRLMARPALPRFLRAGDTLSAGVVLNAKGFGPARVDVTARPSGVTLRGAATRTVSLPRDGAVEVRFDLHAGRAGDARFRFDVRARAEGAGAGESDSVEVVRRVQAPGALEAVALYGSTAHQTAEQLGSLMGIRKDVGALHVSVASTALVGLHAGVEQLVEYPYGCSEQIASRLMPLLPLRDLARDFAIPLPKNVPASVEQGVADLTARQQGDGGFGMWPDSAESSPWVSAYVLWTLNEAKKRGTVLPARTISRGRDYLRGVLESARHDELYWPTAAFIVNVLAEIGTPDPGHLARVVDARKNLPLFGRALVLHALVHTKSSSAVVAELVKELENHVRVEANHAFVNENLGDEYAVLLDSPTRTTAMTLRALLAARPEHPLAAPLARGLLRDRRNGTWRSTQESAYALLALDAYRRAQERAVPDYEARVWFSGKELFSAALRGRDSRGKAHVVPVAQLNAEGDRRLTFQKEGEGTLFYEARLRYVPLALPSAPLDRGFYVQKTQRRVTPEDLPKAIRAVPEGGRSNFSASDLILTDLVVVAPSPRNFVVIDDPLPAGFEAIDANLANTASWLRVPQAGGEPGAVDCPGCDVEGDDALAHGRAFLSAWFRSELRDDRALFFVDHMPAGMYHYRYLARATTPGKFVVPPTKVEQMYAPEVFGRTAASSVEVR
ncbi:MAG TPA: MG2 domain-containing protein [Polyangiaceae bacterium]